MVVYKAIHNVSSHDSN